MAEEIVLGKTMIESNHSDFFAMKYMTEDNVKAYLRSHPEVLENYIMDELDLDLLERWMIRRTQRTKKRDKANSCRKTSLSRWKFCVHADKRAMLKELTASIQQSPTESRVLKELAKCIASAVNADGHNLYFKTPSGLLLFNESYQGFSF